MVDYIRHLLSIATFSTVVASRSSPPQVAEQAGLQSRGQIGQLQGHYLLCSRGGGAASVWGGGPEDVLAAHPHVLWHSQEKVLSRSKRSLAFNDPSYPKQWHLVRICPPSAPPASSFDLIYTFLNV